MPIPVSGIIAALARYSEWSHDATRALSELRAEAQADLDTLDDGPVSAGDLHRLIRAHRNRLDLERIQARSLRWRISALLQVLSVWERQGVDRVTDSD